MDNIIGFRWHLPLAFRTCISECKFEKGDTIYLDQPKGKNWEENIQKIEFLIQIQSPLRSSTTAQSQDLNIFFSNWNSPVTFEKIYPKNHKLNEVIKTTQGRLFSFLWKNDESVFKEQNILTSIITSAQIRSSEPLNPIISKSIGWINEPLIKTHVAESDFGFATIYDQAIEANDLKNSSIRKIFETFSKNSVKQFSCEQMILMKSEPLDNFEFSPSLRVLLYTANKNHRDDIDGELKSLLYKGNKGMYRLSSHGLIIE